MEQLYVLSYTYSSFYPCIVVQIFMWRLAILWLVRDPRFSLHCIFHLAFQC